MRMYCVCLLQWAKQSEMDTSADSRTNLRNREEESVHFDSDGEEQASAHVFTTVK